MTEQLAYGHGYQHGFQYDYVIVGAGPVGLTLAWLLANEANRDMKIGNRKILVIDREAKIGGCHRVRRDHGFFTEHGPRIYSNNYLNLEQILNDMNISFNKIFTPYQISNIGMSYEILSQLSVREILLLGIEYFKLILNPHHGINQTVLEFMNKHNYSVQARDILNRLCRLTDGAGVDRYTLLELLSGFDQHFFYQFYQPRRPNDVYLFPMWKKRLEETGLVTFMLETQVEQILYGGDRVQGVALRSGGSEPGQGNFQIKAKNVILALPPESAFPIINKIGWGNKTSDQLYKFVEQSKYDAYLPVIFHWNKELPLGKIWGFPATSWGILSVKMSDYMQFDNPDSQTVISCCITMTDQRSQHTGKTANQSSKAELIHEAFKQLNEIYGGLPPPTRSILSPGVYRDGNKWKTEDASFVLTPDSGFLRQQNNPSIKGLSWIGTHNGYSFYNFTSMESAVTNALAYFMKDSPQYAHRHYQLLHPLTLSRILRYIFIFVIILIALGYMNIYQNHLI